MMESTKNETGCGPDSSDLVVLEGGESSCGRDKDPSRLKKKECYLQFKRYLFLTFILALSSGSFSSTHRTSGT